MGWKRIQMNIELNIPKRRLKNLFLGKYFTVKSVKKWILPRTMHPRSLPAKADNDGDAGTLYRNPPFGRTAIQRSASSAKDRWCFVAPRPTSHSVSRTAYNKTSTLMSKTPDFKKKINASRSSFFRNLPLCHADDAER